MWDKTHLGPLREKPCGSPVHFRTALEEPGGSLHNGLLSVPARGSDSWRTVGTWPVLDWVAISHASPPPFLLPPPAAAASGTLFLEPLPEGPVPGPSPLPLLPPPWPATQRPGWAIYPLALHLPAVLARDSCSDPATPRPQPRPGPGLA